MNLTFKRGTHANLNDTDITQDMLYFTTDDNCIYMDNDGKRYKIFGLNNSDIISTKDAASPNTYYNNSSHLFLKSTDVAQDGNTTSKIAIGSGYYDNVIGEDIQDILYTTDPTLTSSILYLKNNARGNLDLLWTNTNPSSTWSTDFDGNTLTSNETKIIPVSPYLGYIVFIQACLSDQSVKTYPVTLFNLPSSVLSTYGVNGYSREFDWQMSMATMYEREESSIVLTQPANINVSLSLSLNANSSNFSNLTITKKGTADYSYTTPYQIPFHNYIVPVAIYGWKV